MGEERGVVWWRLVMLRGQRAIVMMMRRRTIQNNECSEEEQAQDGDGDDADTKLSSIGLKLNCLPSWRSCEISNKNYAIQI